MEMEVCCTLSMFTVLQAERLKEAGLYACNHNLADSEEYYNDIICTRQFDDRIHTMDNVQKSDIYVCSGGIIGIGITIPDLVNMLVTLAHMPGHPESVPGNALLPVDGTLIEKQPKFQFWDTERMIATA